MQGGIRRKKDLLPRYKKNGGFSSNRNRSYLTTPMKKILAYIGLLGIVYLVLRVAYSDLNKIPTYELERLENEKINKDNNNHNNNNVNVKSNNEDTTIDEMLNDIKQNDKNNMIDQNNNNNNNNNNNKDTKNVDERKKIPKDKFNNEVAMQQETKNLENDLKPHVDAKDIPNKGPGNVVDDSAAKIAQNKLVV